MKKGNRTASSGLRKIATLQTLIRNTKSRERPQVANRFARLENERARLEREIGTWENCRQTAAGKLARVRAEIDALRPLLNEAPARQAAHRKGRGQGRGRTLMDARGPTLPQTRTMALEY